MKTAFSIVRKLRNYSSSNGRQVFIRVRMKGMPDVEIQVYDYVKLTKIPISVKTEHWNKGYVTGGNYHISIRDFNYLLKKVEDNVSDAVYELLRNNVPITRENVLKLTYINEETFIENEKLIQSGKVSVNEDGGAFASEDEFVDFVSASEDPKFNSLKKKLGIFQKKYILDYWDDFIKNYAPNSYNSPRKSIERYIEATGNNCEAAQFSDVWLESYFKYIVKNGFSWNKDGSKPLDYTVSTINKYHKHLRSFGDYLFKEIQVLENQNYRRFTLQKSAKKTSILKYKPEPFINTHALYKKEFDYFFNYKFTDEKLALTRDMFVLQTWLGGLRACDFLNLTDINFHKDSNGRYRVWFEQKKTDDEVLNPANRNYLEPILDKYSKGFGKFVTAYHYNKLLKKAARTAGLDRLLKFREEIAKDNNATIHWHPIHEKISNKWARNCAVSILCELGFPDNRIMKFTGHRDIRMINHYKSVHQKDVDSMLESVAPEQVVEL